MATESTAISPNYKEIGAKLDKLGWQQFSFLKAEDHAAVAKELGLAGFDGVRLLVVSHSCDLIHHTEQEKFAEILGLEQLQAEPTDDLAKPSPRMRIVRAYAKADLVMPIFLRAKITNKWCLGRQFLQEISPADDIQLRSASDDEGIRGRSERELCDWLSARYLRGWSASEFDRRLKKGVGKIQPSLGRLLKAGVEEIFVRVTPSGELKQNDPYEVTLILLVEPSSKGNIAAIRAEAKILAGYIHQQGSVHVVTQPQVELSTDIGYGYLRGMLRFAEVFRDALAASEPEKKPSTPPALPQPVG